MVTRTETLLIDQLVRYMEMANRLSQGPSAVLFSCWVPARRNVAETGQDKQQGIVNLGHRR